MKKILSILFAGLLIVSSVHLTVAIHYCGNVFETYKVSVSGEKASCGMKPGAPACNNERTIRHNCCNDKVASYLVNDNYSPTFFHFIKFTHNNFVALIGIENFLSLISPVSNVQITQSPPGECLPNQVSISSICVYRI
jgi:hypothetical protein